MKQYQQLIDGLAIPYSEWDTMKCSACNEEIDIIPQILIGDILEKMKEKGGGIHKIMGYMELVKLWQDCGFTKSLQNINDSDTIESEQLLKFLYGIFKDM